MTDEKASEVHFVNVECQDVGPNLTNVHCQAGQCMANRAREAIKPFGL